MSIIKNKCGKLQNFHRWVFHRMHLFNPSSVHDDYKKKKTRTHT